MIMSFPTLFYNYKVVGYEVIFPVVKYQNFSPSESKNPKKREATVLLFSLD